LAEFGRDGFTVLMRLMEDQDVTVRMAALDASPRLGECAQAAVPYIAKFLGDPILSTSASIALARVAAASRTPDTTALKLLLDTLQAGDIDTCRTVINAFEFMGEKLTWVTPALVGATHHSDEVIRNKATRLLSKAPEGSPT
jgi:HEAT repeat protein